MSQTETEIVEGIGSDYAIKYGLSVSEDYFFKSGRDIGHEASAMIVSGFVEPITKELPLEYAVEMNRLIQLQMEGSVG